MNVRVLAKLAAATATGCLGLYLYHRFVGSVRFFGFFYFSVCLLAIALIDLKLMLIPTALIYPTAALEPSEALLGPWLWRMIEPAFGPRVASFAGALVGFLLGWGFLKGISLGYKAVRGHNGMGDGDPPLLGMIGVFLGWRAIPILIVVASSVGFFSGAVLMLISKKSLDESWARKSIPFGPFLALAAFFGSAVS